MTASQCRVENHIEIEPQRLNAFLYICFDFDETKFKNCKLYGELRPVLKHNFKEQKEFSDCAENRTVDLTCSYTTSETFN